MATYYYCKKNKKRLSLIGKIVYGTIIGAVMLILLITYREPLSLTFGSKGLIDNMIMLSAITAFCGINLQIQYIGGSLA